MSSRRRRPSRRERITVGHWVALVIFVLTSVGLGIVTASMIMDRSEPTTWGTFTEERCIAARRGCQSFGFWVSDDGRERLDDAVLEGRPDDDGTVAAYYRPTDTFNDGPPWHVRTQPAEDRLLWVIPTLLALFVTGSGVLTTTIIRGRRRASDAPTRPRSS